MFTHFIKFHSHLHDNFIDSCISKEDNKYCGNFFFDKQDY